MIFFASVQLKVEYLFRVSPQIDTILKYTDLRDYIERWYSFER